MKKRKRLALLAHAVIILSLSQITFFILNILNPLMGFMSSRYSLIVMGAYYILSLLLGICCVALCRRQARPSRRSRETGDDVPEPADEPGENDIHSDMAD